ncbi:unnamed protein product [Caenorhabditis bovis]|uniref:Uncharacterized protein n=1 Tax=Caenorhabditis bovis TaxID=2654633 RepID=A0A8S1EL44_9PELO|nr:unnamed protein product [Caenorhabditis bovis]
MVILRTIRHQQYAYRVLQYIRNLQRPPTKREKVLMMAISENDITIFEELLVEEFGSSPNGRKMIIPYFREQDLTDIVKATPNQTAETKKRIRLFPAIGFQIFIIVEESDCSNELFFFFFFNTSDRCAFTNSSSFFISSFHLKLKLLELLLCLPGS